MCHVVVRPRVPATHADFFAQAMISAALYRLRHYREFSCSQFVTFTLQGGSAR